MKRWLLMVLLSGFLGAAGLDASADQGRRARHVRHLHQHHHQHHNHHHVRPFTGIVVVPALVSPYVYVPVPYSPAYGVPPAPAAAQGYAPGPPEYQYFCPDKKLYYPAVLECPSGWLAVVPGVGAPPGAPYH